MLNSAKKDLQKLKNPAKAKLLAMYFKTGKGEYGEGDKFLGIIVPEQRKIAKRHIGLDLASVEKLLRSEIHEHRLTALLIAVAKYQKANEEEKKKIVNFYLRNTRWINNWDLVDLSAPRILGAYLRDKNRKILYKLTKSKNIWERRIAVLASFYFINECEFADALKLAKMLLKDRHDLIHKAVGWMLREIGKRDYDVAEKFMAEHSRKMPRVMLRYAIERYPENKRKKYLQT